MPYTMRMSVDGGCRRNGYSNAIAAAAVVVHRKWGGIRYWTRRLPNYPRPTNQAAELTAIVLALELALQKYKDCEKRPYMRVTITTDMGLQWMNSSGRDVANQELIQRALELEDEIEEDGIVMYEWVPRGENTLADECVNEELDEMEEETDSTDGYSSSDY
ncbi:MAG: hypothetical protein LQ350_006665 [Teloschistes chrysophthalmus]|nr:MAG: hypothetical protein LQ350_006665 [Niorma chrysophthalma]